MGGVVLCKVYSNLIEKKDIQLLPETRKKIEIKVPGENRMLICGIVATILVAGLFFGLKMHLTSLEEQISQINQEIAELEIQRNKKAEKDLLALGERISVASSIVNDHILLTKAFEKIESLLSRQVQVLSLEVSVGSKNIKLNMVATTYTAIAKQIAAFLADDVMEDVVVGKISPGSGGLLEFGMELDLASSKFFKKE